MKTIEINGKEYKLDIDKAKEQGLLKEKDSKPRSWEEYVKMAETVQIVPCDAYASYFDRIDQGKFTYDRFNSSVEAKAFCAFGKLIQLRDAWCGDWKPDWSNDEVKYHVWIMVDEICIDKAIHIQHVLAFPTEEMAIDFLNTFRDLTEEAKMFL
jgi:hypothetical protein